MHYRKGGRGKEREGKRKGKREERGGEGRGGEGGRGGRERVREWESGRVRG